MSVKDRRPCRWGLFGRRVAARVSAPPGGALRVVSAGRGLPSLVHGSCGGRTLRIRRRRATGGRIGVSGLGLGQVDREGPNLLTFFDHLQSDGEGHSVAEDHIRKGNANIFALVLHAEERRRELW